MNYKVEEVDGHAIIIDDQGRSIVNIVSNQGRGGQFHQTPVFQPGVARRIVAALNLIDAINGVVVTKPGIYL
jgi:hypothetical protein